jgi:hypothetical protein
LQFNVLHPPTTISAFACPCAIVNGSMCFSRNQRHALRRFVFPRLLGRYSVNDDARNVMRVTSRGSQSHRHPPRHGLVVEVDSNHTNSVWSWLTPSVPAFSHWMRGPFPAFFP